MDEVAGSSLRLVARCRSCALLASVLTLFAPGDAVAQNLTIYDDALQNGFLNYSYGDMGTIPPDFGSTAAAHSGTKSIAFTGDNYNAVSFARPITSVTTAQFPTLHFWIHGGAAGNQQLQVVLENGPNIVAYAELDTYITGGAPAAGVWREVTVALSSAPLSYAGTFDRIDIQTDSAGAQGVLYIDDVALVPPAPGGVNTMQIEHGVTVVSMVSDRFTWVDSSGEPRVASLAHNDGQIGPSNARGGSLREFRYQLPNGAQRIAGVTTYPNAGNAGFGYVVSHASGSTCVGDDSPLGGFEAGNGFERVFEGRHHAIFRFHQNYPRNCDTSGMPVARTLPVTIDWMFTTGHDNPVWAVTYDIDLAAPAAPVGTFWDDSRAPYGELNIDGDGSTDIDGVAWGDRFKFTTTTVPATLSSQWDWTAPNTVPYVKEWLAGPLTGVNNTKDATMGIVQTQTMSQQDAAGGRYAAAGIDLWGKTSAMGPGCGALYVMPCANDWPYQANANSLGVAAGSNNARLTWKTQYGFLGRTTYAVNDGVVATAPGYPKKSYSTYIVLGTHTSGPVEAQVTQVETIQTVTFNAVLSGSVTPSGPAGVTRADTVTYSPAGYNHVYGAWAFHASNNVLDLNIAVGAGTLRKPLIIVSDYTAGYPVVKLGGATLVEDADYFPSLRPVANELWITLNRDLTGAANHLEIIEPAGVPDIPAGVTAAGVTSTRVDITWNAAGGALSYQVDRKGPGGGGFVQVGTPNGTSYADLTAAAGTAYQYRVRAVNNAGVSGNSTPDLATTVVFTDAPLNAGTAVKAAHLAELRAAADAVRALAGLGAGVYTDAVLTGTIIKGVHVTEIRSAIDAARAALGLSIGGYTDAALAGVPVKAVHVGELRLRVQ